MNSKDKNELDELLKKFDWRFYTSYYEGLKELKEKYAKIHFIKYGYKEGRICCKEQLSNNEVAKLENPIIENVVAESENPIVEDVVAELENPIVEYVVAESENPIIENVVKLEEPIINISMYNNTLIYYSRTSYNILFQRPHQIMRFFDKSFNKIFIGIVSEIHYEEKYNLWVVPYECREEIYKLCKLSNSLITYYTDSRLYEEIKLLECEKIYDLIDAPIDEFSLWKKNLEKCVKTSDYVMYSHPELVKYLNGIDDKKTYYYISNACDYEHFSKAKNRIGERPQEFPNTDKPILGYYGAFAKWLDLNLILKYAYEGKYHIVMIGGIPNCAAYNIRLNHPNITCIDHKPYDELPYYLSWFDVCFLPFKSCELTKYVNPCKLWEYMASEKEIIKTNVNMDVSIIVKYEDECEKILDFFKIKYSAANIIKKYNVKNELNYDFNVNLFTNVNNKLMEKQQSGVFNDKPVIIMFSMIDFYFRVQRSQHLGRLCAENGYVVYYLKTHINTKTKDIDIRELYPNLYEIGLWCETDRNISVYSTDLTNKEIESLIDSIECLQYTQCFTHFTSYVANPFWLQIIKYINNTSVIFDCLDYTKGFNTHSNLILELEDKIIENEYVIYTSPILKQLTNCNHMNFSYIRNGCDFDYFNKIIQTKIINKNNKKIIGYYGAISDWWDVDLVEQLILQFPNNDFHFIGNVYCNNITHTNKINNLNKYSNVTFFGEIPYDQLTKYISNFDVGIIPFIINDLIKCTNPVKLYEMFSFGLPVVLTELPDVLTLNINDLCYISKTTNDFINNIEKAINEDEEDILNKRILYAKNNSWKNRFEQFDKVINIIRPKISIILLCWNNWLVTKRCIQSVLENSNYCCYELIIVNNNSTDETYEQLNTYYITKSNIKIIHNDDNYGFAMGMNIGVLNASADYIILLNNDTIVGKNWLYPLVKPLILNNYGIGSPITNNCGNEVKQFIYYNDIDDLMVKSFSLQKYNLFKTCEIDRVPFFCPVLRKKDFFSVGMLDINYKFGGWEDDDLIHKLKIYNNGKQNYYTFGSFVYHIESLTMSQVTKQTNWTKNNPNKNYFEKKWNTNWIAPRYNTPKINIKLNSNKKWVYNLLNNACIANNKIFDINNSIDDSINNNIIIISDSDKKEKILDNEIIIISENNNIIVKNNFDSIVLEEPKIINLYRFINTTLFCKNIHTKFCFIHIEKCGGTNFKNLCINSFYTKNNNIVIDNIDYCNNDKNIKIYNILNNAKFLLFHQNLNDAHFFFKYIYLFKVTIIRDPIKRLLSHYYHMIINCDNCVINNKNHQLYKPFIPFFYQNIEFIIDYIINYGNLIVYRLGFRNNIESYNFQNIDYKNCFSNAILNISQLKYIFLLEDFENELIEYNNKFPNYKINNTNLSFEDNPNINTDVFYNKEKNNEYEFVKNILKQNNIELYDVKFYNYICDLKHKEQFKIDN
jgi:GT2 family glycosyltransferase